MLFLQIVRATHDQFSNLSIQQFYQLYRSFRIWSNQVSHVTLTLSHVTIT